MSQQGKKEKRKSCHEPDGVWDREGKEGKRPASDPHRFLELESMDVEKWIDLLCLFSLFLRGRPSAVPLLKL